MASTVSNQQVKPVSSIPLPRGPPPPPPEGNWLAQIGGLIDNKLSKFARKIDKKVDSKLNKRLKLEHEEYSEKEDDSESEKEVITDDLSEADLEEDPEKAEFDQQALSVWKEFFKLGDEKWAEDKFTAFIKKCALPEFGALKVNSNVFDMKRLPSSHQRGLAADQKFVGAVGYGLASAATNAMLLLTDLENDLREAGADESFIANLLEKYRSKKLFTGLEETLEAVASKFNSITASRRGSILETQYEAEAKAQLEEIPPEMTYLLDRPKAKELLQEWNDSSLAAAYRKPEKKKDPPKSTFRGSFRGSNSGFRGNAFRGKSSRGQPAKRSGSSAKSNSDRGKHSSSKTAGSKFRSSNRK
jgi:hypothetical protein